MAQNGTAPHNLDSLSPSDIELDDSTEDLFASPSVTSKKLRTARQPESQQTQGTAHPPDSEEDALASHEASLRRELSSLRTMNQVVSGVIESLDRAKNNMETVSATVSNASTLLTTWTRILSQTEHNQRLILSSNWQGSSQDIADGENEEVLKRQQDERRQAEEQRREEAQERVREEEERRRMTEGPSKTASRGRSRGIGRGIGRATNVGHVGVGGQGGIRGTARAGVVRSGRAGSGLTGGRNAGRGRGGA